MQLLIFSTILAVIITFVIAQTPCENIRTRAQWNAAAPKQITNLTATPKGVFIHHTAGHRCSTQEQCDQRVRDTQTYHMNAKGWDDIAYHFLVGDTGVIYEGRGYGRQGAHAFKMNRISLGLNFIGDFSNTEPTQEAVNAAKEFIECSRANGYLTATHWISGHRNNPHRGTVCPGDKLYDIIQTWPGFTTTPN